MRVSVEKEDPGYAMFLAIGGKDADAQIIMDGNPLKYVISADTETGEAVVLRLDLQGQPIAKACGQEYERDTLRGAIVIMPGRYMGRA